MLTNLSIRSGCDAVADDSFAWYSRCPAPTASVLAIEYGWWQRHLTPLGVVARALDESAVGRSAHFHHQISGLFRDGGNIPPMWAKSRGQKTRVIAANWVREYQVIAVRSDMVDLDGGIAAYRLGLPQQAGARVDFYRAMALRGFQAAFEIQGANWSEARIIDVSQPQPDYAGGNGLANFHDAEVDALLAGHADAIYLKGAVGFDTLHRFGLRVLIDIGNNPDRMLTVNSGTPRVVTVDQAFIDRRPDVVQAYLVSMIEAAQWAFDHENEVLLAGKHVAHASIHGVQHGYGKNMHCHLMPELSTDILTALAYQNDFLLREGFTQEDVDVTKWVEPSHLEQAFARARRDPVATLP